MTLWRWLALTLMFSGLLASACSSGEPSTVEDKDELDPAASEPQPEAAVEAEPSPFDFCLAASSLEGERPEAYVGSTEHINDISGLAILAPEEIQEQAATYRDFLNRGGIDPADPESNVLLNWPADVQAAVVDLTEFISTNC